MHTPERAGWYDDPEDPEQLRYFDGIVWSQHRVPKQAPARPQAAVEEMTGAPQGAPPAPVGAPGQPGQLGQPGQPGPGGGWQQPAAQHPRPAPGTGVVARDGRPLAGLGARAAAWLLDALIIGVLCAITSGWAWALGMRDYVRFVLDNADDPTAVSELTPTDLMAFMDWAWLAVAVALVALTVLAYQVLMLTRWSATLGKLAAGIRVRPQGADGPVTAGMALRRAGFGVALWLLGYVPILSWIAMPLLLVDHVWAVRDPLRQTWHDKVGGTEVVRA